MGLCVFWLDHFLNSVPISWHLDLGRFLNLFFVFLSFLFSLVCVCLFPTLSACSTFLMADFLFTNEPLFYPLPFDQSSFPLCVAPCCVQNVAPSTFIWFNFDWNGSNLFTILCLKNDTVCRVFRKQHSWLVLQCTHQLLQV